MYLLKAIAYNCIKEKVENFINKLYFYVTNIFNIKNNKYRIEHFYFDWTSKIKTEDPMTKKPKESTFLFKKIVWDFKKNYNWLLHHRIKKMSLTRISEN